MAYKKLIQILDRLYKKTTDNEITWEATATKDQFQTTFSKYSITLERQYDHEAEGHYLVMKIFNEEGQEIESLYEGDAIQSGFAFMGELFERARRIALGVEKAIDELLDELEALPSPRK